MHAFTKSKLTKIQHVLVQNCNILILYSVDQISLRKVVSNSCQQLEAARYGNHTTFLERDLPYRVFFFVWDIWVRNLNGAQTPRASLSMSKVNPLAFCMNSRRSYMIPP